MVPNMWRTPHFVRDYRRHVKTPRGRHDLDTAMSLAVGGRYEAVGQAQLAVLRPFLRDDVFIVDVGCGSGRTAYALRDLPLRYHGTDVVGELIEYAKEKVARPDWRFTVVDGLTIP